MPKQTLQTLLAVTNILAARILTGELDEGIDSVKISALTIIIRDNFEEAVAALEHGKYALAFASGSATTATILQSLAAGSHVISVSDVYGGTHRYFTKVASAHGVDVTFSHSIELEVEKLIRPNDTKLIWIETPSNPTLGLVDIEKIAEVAHARGIRVVVDNTFMSPYVQNPLDHGADIVVHSVTKYINGHSVCFTRTVCARNLC